MKLLSLLLKFHFKFPMHAFSATLIKYLLNHSTDDDTGKDRTENLFVSF